MVVDLVVLEELLGGDSFASDMVGDSVGVVGGEELAFLVVEAYDFGAGARGFLVRDRGHAFQVFGERSADAVSLQVGELECHVVALEGVDTMVPDPY